MFFGSKFVKLSTSPVDKLNQQFTCLYNSSLARQTIQEFLVCGNKSPCHGLKRNFEPSVLYHNNDASIHIPQIIIYL